ncbi:MAG TPA: hypothetical protein PKD05_00165, partial [Candidatus Melainabacteria bacterium]|nr:hypothetical protein [Candidatus Melainabacteria bacterium]
DDFDSPAKAPGKSKKSLRSPLLGGEDDEPASDFPRRGPRVSTGLDTSATAGSTAKKAKSKLRSPLLGDEDEDFDQDFEPGPGTGTGHGKGLRSPLLGSEGGDSFDSAPVSRSVAGKSGGKTRLRSPVLGGGDDLYDPYDDEYEETNEEDPNVLRSPLLMARTPKHELTRIPQPENSPAPGPAPGPGPGPAPTPMPPQIPQMPQMPRTPQMPPMPALGELPQQQIQPVQAPASNMPPLPMPAQPEAPPPPSPVPVPVPAPAPRPAPAPVPKADESAEIGPKDRRAKDRRAGGRERRSFSSLRDDEQRRDDDFAAPRAPQSAGPYMAIIITASLGLMYKLYYLVTIVSTYGIPKNELMVFDQLIMMMVFGGLIIFAIGAKKS